MPRDYITAAKRDGCAALGFSDHAPLPDRVWQGTRMTPFQAPGYMQAVREAATDTDFPVYAGFECEWHPQFKSWITDFLLGELQADYLAFGPHWLKEGNEFLWVEEIQSRTQLYRYADLVIEGIQSGLFSFVAHPDLIMTGWRSWDADIRECLGGVIDAAVDAGLPLEVNGNGLDRALIQGDSGLRHPYPVREFWELALEKGAQVICNSDAHRPESVIAWAVNAREFAAEVGCVPVERLSFF
jgi:histidinol-phosphatase (PHP family)